MKTQRLLLWACSSAIYCALLIGSRSTLPAASSEKQQWTFIGGKWQEHDKRLEGESAGHGFALSSGSHYAREQTMEVTFTPLRRVSGQSWAAGGLCLFQDAANFWRLSLVESPTGERYAELIEMHNDVWQAQNEGTTALRVLAAEGRDVDWKFGTPYRLRLTVAKENITGEVLDAQGKRLSRFIYAFDNAPAVRSGWLAVDVQEMSAKFEGAAQRTTQEAQRMMNANKVALVRDAAMGKTAIANILNDAFIQSRLETVSASLSDLTQPQWWERSGAGILALPNARRLPAAAKEPLLDFLRRGGKLICVGAPLFGEPLFQVGGSWLTEKELAAKRRAVMAQAKLFDIAAEDLTRWQRASNNMPAPSKLSVEQTDKGKALRVDVRNLNGWDNFARSFAQTPYPKGHTLLCFWAKGQRQSDFLSLEYMEQDGSRWIATAPITNEWKYFVLTPQDFDYWQDNPAHGKRGGAGDHFQPQNAARLSIGFAFSHRATDGDHAVLIADLGTAPDPFGAVDTSFEPPKLEGLSPGYKLYPLRTAAQLDPIGYPILAQRMVPLAPKLAGTLADGVSPIARHEGIGLTEHRAYRFVPLMWAYEKGRVRRALAWTLLHFGLPYRGAWWFVLGTSDERFWTENKAALKPFLVETMQRLSQDVFFVEAGVDRFTAYAGEPLHVGARIANFTDREVTLKVLVHLGTEPNVLIKGAPLDFKKEQTIRLAPYQIETVRWQVPLLPPADYGVTVAMFGEPRNIYDDMHHDFSVIARPKVTNANKVTVRNSHFSLNGKRWFAMGVNFWPRYAIGLEPGDYWVHWLDPRHYDPNVVEQDLNIAKRMGVNCASIQYGAPEQALSLRDFLRRCHEKGIKVNVFIPGANPLHFDPDLVKRLIEAADLANQPAMFAYDVAWEPTWGRYEQRKAYDAAWRAWLTKRYGSIEKAEEAWGFKANNNEKGEVSGPTDEQVTSDGAWRKMVIDYRRFQDDHLSEGYAKVRQHIKSLDPNHLIGVRTGWGGGPFINSPAMPFDHASGVEHLDFVSPEGWNLSGSWENVERGAFITAYARAVSGGKPVFWAEFGFNAGYPLSGVTGETEDATRNTPDVLQQQAQHYENIYRMVKMSDADGAMAWWFPGGYRVDEKSDYGIVNPDGTPRPAGDVLRRYVQTFANMPLSPTPDTWIEIDRFADPRGAWAVWLKHADEFVKLMRQGKRVGLKMPPK